MFVNYFRNDGPVDIDDQDTPTSDFTNILLYGGIGAVVVIGAFGGFLFFKKKKEEEEENN